MASELWKSAFEKLKLSDMDHSPANFKNDSNTTDYPSHYRAEKLEYERNSKNISEKYNIQEGKAVLPDLKCSGYIYKKPPISDDSYFCKSQRQKKSREKIKKPPSKTGTMEIKKTEKICKETLPVEKEMIDQKAQVSNEGKEKSEISADPEKKKENIDQKAQVSNEGNEKFEISADPEKKKIDQKAQVSNEGNEKSEISADPEKKKPYNYSSDHCYNPTKPLNKKKYCKKIMTSEERKPISKQRGRFRRVEASEVNKDYNSKNIGKCSCISALRYTQADRMAAPPMILSEIWDTEEDW